MVKNLPANAGDRSLIPGPGRSLEEEMATHSSILAYLPHLPFLQLDSAQLQTTPHKGIPCQEKAYSCVSHLPFQGRCPGLRFSVLFRSLFVLCQSASRRDSGKEEIVIVTGKEKRQNVMNSPDVVL